MKTTFKHISLFALGMVAVALLTSTRVTPASTSAHHPTLSLKSVTQVLVARDGQETHGDQGKGKGKG